MLQENSPPTATPSLADAETQQSEPQPLEILGRAVRERYIVQTAGTLAFCRSLKETDSIIFSTAYSGDAGEILDRMVSNINGTKGYARVIDLHSQKIGFKGVLEDIDKACQAVSVAGSARPADDFAAEPDNTPTTRPVLVIKGFADIPNIITTSPMLKKRLVTFLRLFMQKYSDYPPEQRPLIITDASKDEMISLNDVLEVNITDQPYYRILFNAQKVPFDRLEKIPEAVALVAGRLLTIADAIFTADKPAVYRLMLPYDYGLIADLTMEELINRKLLHIPPGVESQIQLINAHEAFLMVEDLRNNHTKIPVHTGQHDITILGLSVDTNYPVLRNFAGTGGNIIAITSEDRNVDFSYGRYEYTLDKPPVFCGSGPSNQARHIQE